MVLGVGTRLPVGIAIRDGRRALRATKVHSVNVVVSDALGDTKIYFSVTSRYEQGHFDGHRTASGTEIQSYRKPCLLSTMRALVKMVAHYPWMMHPYAPPMFFSNMQMSMDLLFVNPGLESKRYAYAVLAWVMQNTYTDTEAHKCARRTVHRMRRNFEYF